jgi:hypothetical protein
VQKSAPFSLLASSTACLVLVNVVLAQVIIRALYPSSGAELGPAVLTALAVVTVVLVVYTVIGWRSYLRRPPEA